MGILRLLKFQGNGIVKEFYIYGNVRDGHVLAHAEGCLIMSLILLWTAKKQPKMALNYVLCTIFFEADHVQGVKRSVLHVVRRNLEILTILVVIISI